MLKKTTYLGIYLTKGMQDPYTKTYASFAERLKDDLNK